MKWLKRIGLILAVAVLIVGVLVAVQPNEYRVTRSATITATPAVVFAQVNDLHAWEAWSPWAKLDPNMKNTYAGPATGTGAMYSWAGNGEVGVGKMTITASQPSEIIRFQLDFQEPFASSSQTEFTFAGQGEQTTVTWTMTGQKCLMCKFFSLFMNMDQCIGGQFEQGLASLKTIAEQAE
jgi:uncharacterized protein YndB with AHSA1/START domain